MRSPVPITTLAGEEGVVFDTPEPTEELEAAFTSYLEHVASWFAVRIAWGVIASALVLWPTDFLLFEVGDQEFLLVGRLRVWSIFGAVVALVGVRRPMWRWLHPATTFVVAVCVSCLGVGAAVGDIGGFDHHMAYGVYALPFVTTLTTLTPVKRVLGTLAVLGSYGAGLALYPGPREQLGALGGPILFALTCGFAAVLVGHAVYTLIRANFMHRALMAMTARHLEEADHVRTRFLAVASHQLRSPLHAIVNVADLLAADPQGAEAPSYVETIRTSARTLVDLVNDVLDYSKLDAERFDPDLREVELRAWLAEIAARHTGQAADRGLAFHTDLAKDVPPYVRMDPARVRQAIAHLVLNAIAFTEVGHVGVEVRWLPMSSTLALTVMDTGVGIAERHRERIFAAFQRVSSANVGPGGAGLGLAISRRIVRSLGGDLRVTSQVGRGSRFQMTIPVEEVAAPVLPDPPAPAEVDRPLRALAVDDSRVALTVNRAVLASKGFEVTTANDGAEAVVACAETRFDFILMDLEMPFLDGLGAAAQIRAGDGPNKTTPIVALTAHALQATRDRVREAGMDDYLTKPLDMALLDAVIARLVRPTGDRAQPSDTVGGAPGAEHRDPP